jgi:hypothetical protein
MTTFSIKGSLVTFIIMTLSIRTLPLCWMALCWVSLCWVSLWWMSLMSPLCWIIYYWYAECHYAECCYVECRYVECRYAKCRSTLSCVPRADNKKVFDPSVFRCCKNANSLVIRGKCATVDLTAELERDVSDAFFRRNPAELERLVVLRPGCQRYKTFFLCPWWLGLIS